MTPQPIQPRTFPVEEIHPSDGVYLELSHKAKEQGGEDLVKDFQLYGDLEDALKLSRKTPAMMNVVRMRVSKACGNKDIQHEWIRIGTFESNPNAIIWATKELLDRATTLIDRERKAPRGTLIERVNLEVFKKVQELAGENDEIQSMNLGEVIIAEKSK
jgi:hypothetical protein